MKKYNKKLLSLGLGISSLTIMTPIILTSCSISYDNPIPVPEQIINFAKYQKSVYVQKTDEPTKDPFAPVFKDQELYQFAYQLVSESLTEENVNQIKTSFKLIEVTHNNKSYCVNENFRNKELLKKVFLNLTYDLQSEKNAPNLDNPELKLKGIDIFFDKISNENLESKFAIEKTSKDIIWYVYPKKDKFWNVENESTKNAHFSIHIKNKKTPTNM